MELPVTLQNKIVEFLTSLPNIHDPNTQRALIQSAGLDAQLQRKIHFSGPSEQFFQLLIPTLRSYGKLADDRDPLEALLEAAKNYVGGNRQTECEQLIEELRAFSETRQHIQRSNPYRGLFAFREEDERFFFGRETYTQKVIAAVQNKPLVAVIGASGSGKSSLVYAGLIPALRRQGSWLITSFRPGENPFQAVAKSLIPFLYNDELKRLSQTKKLTKQLHAGEISLCDVIARIVEKDEHAEKLLLFVDQFEELYTLCHDDDECRRFLDALLEMQNGSCKLLLTMRADFLGKALSYRPFADAFQNSNILLGPMNHEEIRATIEEPAKMLDVTIEDGLTDRILAAVGEKPGNLPLLEFALTELWKKQTNGILTHAAYDEIGGVEKALTRHADQEFEHLSAAEQARVQRIFTQLFRPGEGTEDTRRIATRTDIGEDNWELVAKLADARLVVTGTPVFPSRERVDSQAEKQEDTVEVVHESLITGWQRLREWIDADREFRTWQERLRFAMRQWITSNHDEGALLRGAPLTEAEEWLGKRRVDLSLEEQHFIEASQAYRDKEIAEREARRQRELEAARKLAEEQRQRAEEQAKAAKKLRNRFILALILAVMAVGAAIVALYGFKQAQEKTALAEDKTRLAEEQSELARQNEELAKQEQERAQQERDKALKTQSLFLADLARQQNEQGFFTRAILLALEALPEDMNNDRPYVLEAEVQLYEAVTNQQEHLIFQGHEDAVVHAAFSPDGTRIVTAANDHTARVWEAVSGQALAILRGHEAAVVHAAFSPDGTRIVTASRDHTARVWEAASGQELRVLQHSHYVDHAAFSPDGTRIVTASRDHTARVWEAVSGQELAVLRGHKSWVSHAAFSPDGTRIVTASRDRTARVWETASGQKLMELKKHSHYVDHAAFSPDGTRIVTASTDHTARVWKAVNGQELAVLKHASVGYAAFSPDGTRIVTASRDGTARVWEAESGQELAVLRGHEAAVNHVVFSPDGTRIVTALEDGTARVWEAVSGRELTVLHGHEAAVNHAAFNPDSTRIVTASRDHTARAWEVVRSQELAVLRGHKSWVSHAAFSPDGTRIVTASTDGTARVWEAVSGHELVVLRGHEADVDHAAFSPDGTRIVTVARDNTARVWEAENGQELAVLKPAARYAAFSPDGTRIVTVLYDNTARVWEAASGQELRVLQHELFVNHAAFSPDGTRIVTASTDGTARVWEAVSGQELAVLRGHEAAVVHAAFSPDGTRIVTASRDNTARVWEAASGQELRVLRGKFSERERADFDEVKRGHELFVNHAAFSPDGTRIVTASTDGTARVWDVSTALNTGSASVQELAVLRGHKSLVFHAAFSPDGTRIVTASLDRTARMWEVESGLELVVLRGHETTVGHAEFSPDGTRIVTASGDGTARVWWVLPSTQALIDYAHTKLPPQHQELTEEEKRQFFLAD